MPLIIRGRAIKKARVCPTILKYIVKVYTVKTFCFHRVDRVIEREEKEEKNLYSSEFMNMKD